MTTGLVACAPAKPAPPLAQAAASAPTLPPSNYELADEGTVFVWRDLNSGETVEERVGKHSGRMMESRYGTRRSFSYVPDPWADNENTDPAGIEPLFPLEVGKKVSFERRPGIGLTKDTVEVLRTETLTLPFGSVDTYVIATESRAVMANWVGKATVWYAPSLRWQVQWVIADNDGDNRRRQVIEVRNPQ
jgi:hypothetical protein